MHIDKQSVEYIMYQRTGYSKILNSLFYRVFQKISPISFYDNIVRFESKYFPEKIKLAYELDMKNEYSSISKFLPKKCNSILDIGCGIAGVDIFLNDHFNDHAPMFYLLDKEEKNENIYYGFYAEAAFYNSLELAKSTLIKNGVNEKKIKTIFARDDNEIRIDRKVDLVISLISWGFHYPVEVYLDKVYELLNKNGSVIIDLRKNTEGFKIVKDKFKDISIILDKKSYHRVIAYK